VVLIVVVIIGRIVSDHFEHKKRLAEETAWKASEAARQTKEQDRAAKAAAQELAAKKKEYARLVAFSRQLGTIRLSPEETSYASLSRILKRKGKPEPSGVENAISFSWNDWLEVDYFKPGYSDSVPAAQLHFEAFPFTEVKGLFRYEDLPNVSFHGLKLGMLATDVEKQMQRLGADPLTGHNLGGWKILWTTDEAGHIDRLFFDNPRYELREESRF